jgi:hypothetical protein
VAAYDEMDANAGEQAQQDMPLSPARRVAQDWRDRDLNFGPLYYKLKEALYGKAAVRPDGTVVADKVE